MSRDKPLPDPRRKRREQPEPEELLADRIARAMAEGRLEEFMDKELKGNENARRLAGMMMEMTGMAPPQAQEQQKPSPQKKPSEREASPKDERTAAEALPRAGVSEVPELIQELSKIAAENRVEMDWIISRALGLYIQDYRTTGRL